MGDQSSHSELQRVQGSLVRWSAEIFEVAIPSWLYCALVGIESLQWLSYHADSSQSNALGMSLLKSISAYVSPVSSLRTGTSIQVLLPFLALFCSLHAYVCWWTLHPGDQPSLRRPFCIQLVAYLGFFLQTILGIPIVTTTLPSIYCSAKSPFTAGLDCYKGYSLVLAIVGFLCILWYLGYNFFVALLGACSSPFRNHHNCIGHNYAHLGRLCLSLLPMIFKLADSKQQMRILFVLSMSGLAVGQVSFFRYIHDTYWANSLCLNFVVACEICLLIMSLAFTAFEFLPVGQQGTLGLILACLVCVPACRLVVVYHGLKVNQSIRILYSKLEEGEETQLQQYLVALYRLIKLVEQRKPQLSLVIQSHKFQCNQIECLCSDLLELLTCCIDHQTDETLESQQQRVAFEWVLQMIEAVPEAEQSLPFSILRGHILFERLSRQDQALFLHSQLIQRRKTLSQSTALNLLAVSIHRNYKVPEGLSNFLEYSCQLTQLQKITKQLQHFVILYWSEFDRLHVAVPRLINALHQITLNKQSLKRCLQKLMSLLGNSMVPFNIMSRLLQSKVISLSQLACLTDETNSSLVSHTFTNAHNQEAVFDQRLIVVTVELNHKLVEGKALCQVRSVTNNVENLLGFQPSNLLGGNLDCLMPTPYHAIHDEFIKNRIHRDSPSEKPKVIEVFCVNKQGYLVRSSLKLWFQSSIIVGLVMVAFLIPSSEAETIAYILYNPLSRQIGAMSETASFLFSSSRQARRKKRDGVNCELIDEIVPFWDSQSQSVRCLSRKAQAPFIKKGMIIGPKSVIVVRRDPPTIIIVRIDVGNVILLNSLNKLLKISPYGNTKTIESERAQLFRKQLTRKDSSYFWSQDRLRIVLYMVTTLSCLAFLALLSVETNILTPKEANFKKGIQILSALSRIPSQLMLLSEQLLRFQCCSKFVIEVDVVSQVLKSMETDLSLFIRQDSNDPSNVSIMSQLSLLVMSSGKLSSKQMTIADALSMLISTMRQAPKYRQVSYVFENAPFILYETFSSKVQYQSNKMSQKLSERYKTLIIINLTKVVCLLLILCPVYSYLFIHYKSQQATCEAYEKLQLRNYKEYVTQLKQLFNVSQSESPGKQLILQNNDELPSDTKHQHTARKLRINSFPAASRKVVLVVVILMVFGVCLLAKVYLSSDLLGYMNRSIVKWSELSRCLNILSSCSFASRAHWSICPIKFSVPSLTQKWTQLVQHTQSIDTSNQLRQSLLTVSYSIEEALTNPLDFCNSDPIGSEALRLSLINLRDSFYQSISLYYSSNYEVVLGIILILELLLVAAILVASQYQSIRKLSHEIQLWDQMRQLLLPVNKVTQPIIKSRSEP